MDKRCIARATYYRWYERYLNRGEAGLQSAYGAPDGVRDRIIRPALEEPDLCPREWAVRFIDAERYFVSEASAYRLLKAHDLITSPALACNFWIR